MRCLTEEQVFAWLDGGVPPNRAIELEAHVAECAVCRKMTEELRTFVGDLAASASVDVDAHARQIMRRIGEGRPRERGPNFTRLRTAAAGLMAAATLAASVVLVVRSRRDDSSEFTARGGVTVQTLRRDVGVTVHAGADARVRLQDGTAIAPDALLTASTTNIHPRPAHLLLFAVDSRNNVHWLAPAYSDPSTDPESMTIERGDRPRALPTQVVLDHPAEGLLRIVSMVTEKPLHVSDVEKRTGEALAVSALEQAFPGASVSEIRVRVERRR